jgi:hypothetical protein
MKKFRILTDVITYHSTSPPPVECPTRVAFFRSSVSMSNEIIRIPERREAVLVATEVEKLEEIDYEGGIKVQVAISAQMVSIATGATVWTNSVSEVRTVSQRMCPAVVSAMNGTMGRAIEKLLSPAPTAASIKPN